MADDKDDRTADVLGPAQLGPAMQQQGLPSPSQGLPFPAQAQALNVSVGNMPAAAAVLNSLPPDLQKQVLTDSTAFANRLLDAQDSQLKRTFDSEDKDKDREHSKWRFKAAVLVVFLIIAAAGVVALYAAGKDAAADKLLTALISLVGGFALGWGAKSQSESKTQSDRQS
jgi:hypothetical protein